MKQYVKIQKNTIAETRFFVFFMIGAISCLSSVMIPFFPGLIISLGILVVTTILFIVYRRKGVMAPIIISYDGIQIKEYKNTTFIPWSDFMDFSVAVKHWRVTYYIMTFTTKNMTFRIQNLEYVFDRLLKFCTNDEFAQKITLVKKI